MNVAPIARRATVRKRRIMIPPASKSSGFSAIRIALCMDIIDCFVRSGPSSAPQALPMAFTDGRGAFLVLAQAAQHVASGGRIIAFSSSVLAKSFPTYGPYIASKAGVEGLVHVLANELRGRNVTFNAVAPGPTGTDLFLNGKTPEQIAQLCGEPQKSW